MAAFRTFYLAIFIYAAAVVYGQAEPVLIVVGDSWGTFGGSVLQKVLKAHGSNLVVKNYAIGGTTTTFWAREPHLVSLIIDENPNTKYLWVSLGGNDVVDFMPNCTMYQPLDDCINILVSRALNNTRSIYDIVFTRHPEVKIVQFGYDILNFAKNVLCRALGVEMLHGCDDRPRCINPQFVKIQELYVDKLGTLYDRVTALNLLGSLQSYYNVSGASIGTPNVDDWSPSALIMDNCIHPTNESPDSSPCGFEIVFNNLWDLYFAKQTEV
eukprot:129967_1